MVRQIDAVEKVEKAERRGNGLKKLAAVAALGIVATGAFAADTQTDSFSELLDVITKWMKGSLGKVIALFGFIGTFVLYAMTHRGSVLFIGVLISLIAGGLVGIVNTFFDIGATSFHDPDATTTGTGG